MAIRILPPQSNVDVPSRMRASAFPLHDFTILETQDKICHLKMVNLELSLLFKTQRLFVCGGFIDGKLPARQQLTLLPRVAQNQRLITSSMSGTSWSLPLL